MDHAEALKPLLNDGMTMPEMALRFILNNKDVSTIIPGMRKRHNVETNLAASDKGPLPAAAPLRTPQTPLGPHPHEMEPVRERKCNLCGLL